MENELEKLMEMLSDVINWHYKELSKEQIEEYNKAIDSIQNIIDLIEE